MKLTHRRLDLLAPVLAATLFTGPITWAQEDGGEPSSTGREHAVQAITETTERQGARLEAPAGNVPDEAQQGLERARAAMTAALEDVVGVLQEERPETEAIAVKGQTAKIPVAQGPPDTPPVPDLPNAPTGPELPDLPDLPDVVTLPGLPDVPGLPDLPDVPQLPDLPDLPDVPDVPDVPDIPDVPQLPDLPEVPDVPDLPDLPDLPDVPHVPDIPDIPDVP